MKKIFLLALCLPLLQACTKKIKEPGAAEKLSIPSPAPNIFSCGNFWQDRGEVTLYFEGTDMVVGMGNKGYFLKWELGHSYRVYEYNTSNGTWTPKGYFPGEIRHDGVIVVVGTKIYFGLGISFENATPIYYHDWWEYDPATEQWTQKANFPGVARTGATAFAAASKAYVVGGYTREVTKAYLKQTWQYDPASDTWQHKANFPGAARDHAAGFGIGDKGYVGTGRGEIIINNNPNFIYFNDFYEYNALTNTWMQKASYPGPTRWDAYAFMILGNGFIGGGYNSRAGYRDLHMYDHLTNAWVEKADYPGYGFANHHFGDFLHFSTTNHGHVIQRSFLTEEGIVPRTMWRYVKQQFCAN
jgi:N-acetylneuraminic acid mutarotase